MVIYTNSLHLCFNSSANFRHALLLDGWLVTVMGKNKPYDALLQGSNRNYGTGIRTTDIRQAEFDSGEWKTVLGEFRMFFHIILLIYREILRVVRNG